jgi:Mediator complex subunit Med5
MQVLGSLVKPKSISGEAELVHGTVLSLVGRTLEHCLRETTRHHPTRGDIDPVLKKLQDHLNYRRTCYSNHSEVESWTGTPPAGIMTAFETTFDQLVGWSTSAGFMTPVQYTHRQLLLCLALRGPTVTTKALVKKLIGHYGKGGFEVALDIATNFICAPIEGEGLEMREVIEGAARGIHRISPPEWPFAHDVEVRLYRRVEGLSRLPVSVAEVNQTLLAVEETVGLGLEPSIDDVMGAAANDMLGDGTGMEDDMFGLGTLDGNMDLA